MIAEDLLQEAQFLASRPEAIARLVRELEGLPDLERRFEEYCAMRREVGLALRAAYARRRLKLDQARGDGRDEGIHIAENWVRQSRQEAKLTFARLSHSRKKEIARRAGARAVTDRFGERCIASPIPMSAVVANGAYFARTGDL